MDDLSIQGEELRSALDELETLNRLLGGHRPSLSGIARLLPEGCRELTLLDVGTGCGDFPRRIARWGAQRDIAIHAKGIDISTATVEHARRRSRGTPNLQFEVQNLLTLQDKDPFDVVHAALFLHHLDDEKAPAALKKMEELSRWGVVINDIHRHPISYHGLRMLLRLLSKNRLIRHDGPVSVLRAFRRTELEGLARSAGIPAPRIRWRWAFRWQVVIAKQQ